VADHEDEDDYDTNYSDGVVEAVRDVEAAVRRIENSIAALCRFSLKWREGALR